METVQLEVSPRQVVGKKVKALRRQGITPLHVYGNGMDSVALQAETKKLQRVVYQVGKNIPVSLGIDGVKDQNISFVREVQLHPITGRLLHVDFYRVNVTERMQAQVPIILTGEAPAVRLQRGVLMQAIYSLTVESLPMDVPESIQLDVSNLDDFEKAIRVSDVALPSEVTILAEPDEMIARVNPPRVEVEEVEEEEAAEGEVEGEVPGEEPQESQGESGE